MRLDIIRIENIPKPNYLPPLLNTRYLLPSTAYIPADHLPYRHCLMSVPLDQRPSHPVDWAWMHAPAHACCVLRMRM